MSPRRTAVLRAVLALGLVLLVIALPAWIASRPGFFGGMPTLTEQYVPWATSTHLTVGCEGCHIPPRVLPRTLYHARLVGEFYLSWLPGDRTPDVFPRPTNEACLFCHSDLRSVSPRGDLQIPHRAHVTILAMDCVECHDFLVHELSPAGTHTPTMQGCLRCHDGDAAKDTCTACHTEKAAPADHAAPDWPVVHALRAQEPECDSCHKWTDDWCVDCHVRRPKSHGDDWRAVHRDRVKAHRSCEACHEAPFCIRCHGELPLLNFDPDLELVR